jgi:flavin reductase (DIM6/NTAB) family NADH-FMN oxidoreductase RutF
MSAAAQEDRHTEDRASMLGGTTPDQSIAPDTDELGLTPDEFKAAFRNHAAGVAVITADAGNGPVGMTATSVFSISATPPLLVFSASELSSSTPTLTEADTVVVHLLGSDDLDLAVLCATSGIDRFADTSMWARLDSGEPYFPNVHAWIRGRIVNKLKAGSSTLFVVKALESFSAASAGADHPKANAQPLVYHNRTWHGLSHESTIDRN